MKRILLSLLLVVAWSIGKSNHVLTCLDTTNEDEKSETVPLGNETTLRGYITVTFKPNGDPKRWKCRPPRDQDCAKIEESGQSAYTITWYSGGFIAGSIQSNNFIIYTDIDGSQVIEID